MASVLVATSSSSAAGAEGNLFLKGGGGIVRLESGQTFAGPELLKHTRLCSSAMTDASFQGLTLRERVCSLLCACAPLCVGCEVCFEEQDRIRYFECVSILAQSP